MTTHLLLRDREFEIESAAIEASVNDPHWCDKYNHGRGKGLFWSIDVETRPREFDGEIWAPRLYFEGFELPVRSWTQLPGQRMEWNDAYDERTGEPNGGIYVFEHENISRGSLVVGPWRGEHFELQWEGRCDVNWDEGDYGTDVPFNLRANAIFAGVRVAASEKDTDASVLARLVALFDVSALRQAPLVLLPSKYEDGVGMARAKFHPVFGRA